MFSTTCFLLKCATHSELSADVVYEFTCWYDTTLSNIGYTARHLVTRAGEHLNFQLRPKNLQLKITCAPDLNVL